MFYSLSLVWLEFLHLGVVLYSLIGLFFAIFTLRSDQFYHSSYTHSLLLLLITVIIAKVFVFLNFIDNKYLSTAVLCFLFLICLLVNLYLFRIRDRKFFLLFLSFLCLFIIDVFNLSVFSPLAEFVLISYIFSQIFSRVFFTGLAFKLCTGYLIFLILSGIIISKLFSNYQREIFLRASLDLKTVSQRYEFVLEYFKNILKSALLLPDTRRVILEGNSEKGYFYLSRLAHLYKADVVYFLNSTGKVVLSSNKAFLKKDVSFRPYFKRAIHGEVNFYIARDCATDIVGLYFAFPFWRQDRILGVLVFKYDIFHLFSEEFVINNFLLMHSSGLVIMGPENFIGTCIECDPEKLKQALRERLLGRHPFKKFKFTLLSDYILCSRNSTEKSKCWIFIRSAIGDCNYFIARLLSFQPLLRYKRTLFAVWSLLCSLTIFVLFEILTWSKWITTDSLSGLLNRRTLFKKIEELTTHAARNKKYLHFLMVDIDKFKKINDQYGHQTGDRVIQHLADIMRQTFRTYDILGRYGGEEFLIVFESGNYQDGFTAAERLRREVMSTPLVLNGTSIHFTVSIGVSSVSPSDLPRIRSTDVIRKFIEQNIRWADEALYVAKKQGRNRTVIYSSQLRRQ